MGALKSLGVAPGDRVAIAGTNSTRYLTLDVAIGMLGAVSVPVYYTSPPADIDHILGASGARLLFVGFDKVLERLGELHADVPVISFCRRPPREPHRMNSVLPWAKPTKVGSGVPEPGVHQPTLVGFALTSTEFIRCGGHNHASRNFQIPDAHPSAPDGNNCDLCAARHGVGGVPGPGPAAATRP